MKAREPIDSSMDSALLASDAVCNSSQSVYPWLVRLVVTDAKVALDSLKRKSWLCQSETGALDN